MTKTILVIHAHPDRSSLTHQLATTAKRTLAELGHRVLESDLYAARWKAVFDADDFLARVDPERLSFVQLLGLLHVIGTPGMRELGHVDSAGGLGDAFADSAALAAVWFRDCRHCGEPRCARP